MRGDILPWRGTVCPSVDCPGEHCAIVQNVRGDIVYTIEKRQGGQILGGTLYTTTTVENIIDAFAAWNPRYWTTTNEQLANA